MESNGTIHYARVSRVLQYRDGTFYDNGPCTACGEPMKGGHIMWRVDYQLDLPKDDPDGARGAIQASFHQFKDVKREFGRYKAHFWCMRALWGLWDPEAPTFCRPPSLPLLARRLGHALILDGIYREMPEFVGFEQFKTTWAKDPNDPKTGPRQIRPPKTRPHWLPRALKRWSSKDQPSVLPFKDLAWMWSAKYHLRSDMYLPIAVDTDEWVRAFARPEIEAAWLDAKAA